MPTKQPANLSYALNLKPEKALEYFQSKGYAVPENLSDNWETVWQEANAKAFTVARATRLDVLKDIREELDKSLQDGKTFRQFQQELEPKLKAKGWWGWTQDEDGNNVQLGSVRRLKTIYDTNINTAYQAGRFREMMENTKNRPYWMYDAVGDNRTRPGHAALNGIIFRYDDPFWDTHYPPNGYNCRCSVRALSENNIKDRKMSVSESKGDLKTELVQKSSKNKDLAPVTTYTDPVTGAKVPADIGWNHNPGKEAWNIDALVYGKAKKVDPALRDKFIADMVINLPRRQAFAGAVGQIIKDGYQAKGIEYTAGWINTSTTNYLAGKKIEPVTPIIAIKDDALAHSVRTAKLAEGKTSIALAEQIPEILAEPDNIFLDEGGRSPALIYTKNLDADNLLKIVVNINQKQKKRPVNEVKTIGIVEKSDIEKVKRYKKIK